MTSLRRRRRCWLCPETGDGANEDDAWAGFERHYQAKHMKRGR